MSDFRNDRSNRSSARGNHAARPGAYNRGQQGSHEPRNPQGSRRSMPVWLMVVLDVLVLGAALNVFAIFQHLIPQSLDNGSITLPTRAPITTKSLKPTASLSATASVVPSDTAGGEATATPDTAATQAPADVGMWGDKFADKFTSGDVEKTDNSYKSHDINVTVSKVQNNGITYFLSDIYVRNLENLHSGLANGKPLSMGQGETTVGQAKRYNAIIAINGDNYGDHPTGMVVRDGVFGRDKSFGDVCVMYNDGTMKTFSANGFKMKDIQSTGAWQVWGFGPMLLDSNGGAMTSFTGGLNVANPRTAIGYYEPGHYCFLVADGRQVPYSKGMTTKEMSDLFASLGCKAAYNLDGGRTSVMAFMANVINKPYEGGRSTSDIIYVGEAK